VTEKCLFIWQRIFTFDNDGRAIFAVCVLICMHDNKNGGQILIKFLRSKDVGAKGSKFLIPILSVTLFDFDQPNFGAINSSRKGQIF